MPHPATSPTRVRLGAIAKNEGPYLVDWIFHHLYFGFDGITIWVNGTTDTSVSILEAITAVEPRVYFRVADRVLEESLREGQSFQFRAYQRMARAATKEGFTHLTCLDLDEYWTPRDLATGIGDFLDLETSVTAFPWCLDVPDLDAAAFQPLFEARPRLQLDRHVKSAVRLDERVRQWRTHTARTHEGPRRWVRETFPMQDEAAQQWGSLVPREWLSARDHVLPDAFVIHALHRSPTEYVASLDRGRRQTGRRIPVKDNRHGFIPSAAPVLEFPAHPDALRDYLEQRAAFHARVGCDDLIEEARVQARLRGEGLVQRAATDRELLQRLRKPLRHVPLPSLEAAHPGWDTPLHWRLERTDAPNSQPPTRVEGWAFDETGAEVEFGFRDGTGRRWERLPVERRLRPDVPTVLPLAPAAAGFTLEVPSDAQRHDASAVLARSAGGSVWEEWPLPG